MQEAKRIMASKGVAISLVKQNGKEIEYTSGIHILKNWVLTHGILLKPKIEKDKKFSDFISTLPPGEIVNLSGREDHLKVQVKLCRKISKSSTQNTEVKSLNGVVVSLWSCPSLIDSLTKLYSSTDLSETFDRLNRILLPIILVIYLNKKDENVNIVNECSVENIHKMLDYFCDSQLSQQIPEKGDDVEIESTPFGNTVFINSISKGIVSNVLGIDKCVMLTDIHAIPGCEGGLVYSTNGKDGSRVIYGMVIAPLSLCRSEWVNYTFVACLLPCLKRLLRKQEDKKTLKINQENFNIIDSLNKCVVLIYCGSEWGSGILLDRGTGTILTCSHVIDKAPNRRIKVGFSRKNLSSQSMKIQWAELIYRTPKGVPYDIAILKVDPKEISSAIKPLKIGNSLVLRGESVISAGYPFLCSNLPTITRGNISNVSSCMLQTTCYVQSGNSGGPIIRPTTGELLGITVCNVITSTTRYPRLNMGVPATVLIDPINEYIKTNRVQALDILMSYDENVVRTWNCLLPSKI
ncbi:peroxisomal leader peptide-processing protease isoform X2 [Cotesia glomerata]|uniref:peroxisomal leader peptide-processing protease isoform X2 n=1 Tax=Cotesia glomerata TaxID=32391 RepID=UPI001D015312|nr:peroxisomal leader peptide-processing protease isoform X2 [Cotesia glomerata]